ERAEASLAEARQLGAENGVEVIATTVRARSIGKAIVERARETHADVIIVGSSPRWRRQSKFFSPTVDYLLKMAPCEGLIVTLPPSVVDEEPARTWPEGQVGLGGPTGGLLWRGESRRRRLRARGRRRRAGAPARGLGGGRDRRARGRARPARRGLAGRVL